MFVFRRDALPKDPVFPADLKQLGYFINERDQIKMITNPEEGFLYKINANDRYNVMQKEAMNSKPIYLPLLLRTSTISSSISCLGRKQRISKTIACIREIVTSRLVNLGFETLRLPIGAAANSQHVPILTSKSFKSQARLIVVFGEPTQELGIWAYRVIGKEGINIGSAVNFASAVLGNNNCSNGPKTDVNRLTNSKPQPGTGLILTNPGQLVWHCANERAISLPMWHALPRRSAVEPPMRMTFRNKIPGNETWQNHITYVFEEVLGKLAASDVKIDVIGLAEGGLGAVRYLAEHWSAWKPRISSLCLTNPLHDTNHLHPPDFANFISTRSRAYLLSEKPLDTPVVGRYEHGCNCYSSGEALNVECIIPRAWESMLRWLDSMFEDPGLEEIGVIVT
ncbi:hypothetical protein ACO22_03614 [Paracoccidioides brasiliensis]|uniref:Arb2 domain-containing protein n=1 Tax=Paracoccidioides brasiliensis TaxID=121759 RepID=A0A1D2JFF9_PARBR|nr:hypothetical protein ACO22_03614 [Paracoccidioides brasiliensis]